MEEELDFTEEIEFSHDMDEPGPSARSESSSLPAGITPELSKFIREAIREATAPTEEFCSGVEPETKRQKKTEGYEDDVSSIFNAYVDLTDHSESMVDSVVDSYETDKKGPELQSKIASFIRKMETEKLSEEKLKEKGDKYPQPQNCELLQLTKVNQLIWNKLKTSTRSNDIKFQKSLSAMVKGMIALAVSIQSLLGSQSSPNKEIIRGLFDALGLIAQGNLALNLARREFIKGDLNEDFRTLCSEKVPITKFLFCDDISKELKEIAEANKIAAKATGSSTYSTGYRYRGRTSFRGRGGRGRSHFLGRGRGLSRQPPPQGGWKEILTTGEACSTLPSSYSFITHELKVAGRLSHFYDMWTEITSDRDILQL
ncbi:hypothetical protein HOLleu_32346 [Holothuria leucospilota]|uniref:Uncharacterized protein n=1 Tax=Holothuria leucospilota TaxID=206669 RepID=A0A9Q0YRI4_HOLLE|nr:hypothetical protein HOLleu_32346 [Holothuria leucospilota]